MGTSISRVVLQAARLTPIFNMAGFKLYFVLATVLFVGSSIASDEADRDVCGDPVITEDMRNDPIKIVEYLRNQPGNQRVENLLDNHPFLLDLEKGKIERDQMQRAVANFAYNAEMELRNAGNVLNQFGNAWPVYESRMFADKFLEMSYESLKRLEPLGRAFDIDDISQLVAIEPDPDALIVASTYAEIAARAGHVSELAVPMAVRQDQDRRLTQRMKRALQNPAYKSWNLSEEALSWFDVGDVDFDDKEFMRVLAPIVRHAADRGVTLCALRRRLNQVNNGYKHLFNAMMDVAHRPKVIEGF